MKTEIIAKGPLRCRSTISSFARAAPRLVAACAGASLLLAATLKAGQIISPPSLSQSPDLLAVGVVWEFFLGLWLISGALPKAARKVAIGCFSVFAQWFATTPIVGETVGGKIVAVVSGRKAMGLQWMKSAVPWAR